MKTQFKRIFALLLTLVLLAASFNGTECKVWAEESDTGLSEETEPGPGESVNDGDGSETDPTIEVVLIEEPSDPSDPPADDPTDPVDDPEPGDDAEPPADPLEDDPVAAVMELLAQIDSLEEMQYYRVIVTREVFRNANGGYSSGNYANRTEQHIEAQNRYQQYLDDMFAKRAEAKAAYDALTDEQKAELAADETAAANLAKLTPYDSLPTYWLTLDRIIIGQTGQIAEQLKFPIPVTPPEEESDPYLYEFVRAYELSLSICAAGYINSFALVDTTTSGDSWMPNGLYEYGSSNYQLAYCCDCIHNAHRGYHYKRINLEDAEYYSDADAAHIRTIVLNSYPFVSIGEMKSFLLANGFDPDMTMALTRSDIIAGVQMAIWCYSNSADKDEYVYRGTCAPIEARDRRDYLLMPSLHDYRNEDWTWYLIAPGDYYSSSGYRYTYYADLEQRINALTEFLCSLPGTEPGKDQIVISNIEIARSALIPGENGTYEIDLNVFLNHGASSDNDDVVIRVTTTDTDGNSVTMPGVIAVDGRTVYPIRATAKDGETITVTVEGTQELEKGAYYYEVKGGTEVSQSLVGVAAGTTRVYVEKSFTFNREAETGIRVFKTAKGSKLPISDITFKVYKVEDADVDQIGEVPTEEEIAKYAQEENLAGSMTTDQTGYSFLALPRGTYLVVEELNADKVREVADPFYVTLPNPVEKTGEDGTVTIVYEDTASFNIENIPAGSVPAELEVTKVFSDWGVADSFTFQLAAVTPGAPMPEETTAVATEDNPTARFGSMIFDRVGTYKYTITERDDGVGGVTYDTEPHSVTVVVTYDENGELAAQISYDEAESLTVTNTFTPVAVVIELTKEIAGREWEDADRFDFVLEPVTAGAPMPQSASASASKAQPVAGFGEIKFTKIGTYAYTVTEQKGNLPGISYDGRKHEVLVKVTKGENNALIAEVLYDGGPKLTVINPYQQPEAEFKVTKQLTGRSWNDNDSFTFRLEPVTRGAPMPPESQVTATKDNKTVSFGTAAYLEPGTYEYRIREVAGKAANVTYDTAAHKVVVTVSLNEKTQRLQAVVTYDNADVLIVTNKYTPPPPLDKPKTGGFGQPVLWSSLAAASLMGMFALLLTLRKFRKN